MAAFSLCCPKCDAILNLAARPAEGKKVKCPKCSTVFVAADNETPAKATAIKPAASRPAAPTASKGRPTRESKDEDDKSPRRRPARADLDDVDEVEEVAEQPRRGKGNRSLDEEDDDTPRRSVKKQKSNTGLVIGLCAGIGVLFLALAGTAGGMIWWLTKSEPASVAKVQESKSIAPQDANKPQVQPPNNANRAQAPAPGPNVKVPDKPANNRPNNPRRKPPVQPANPQPQPAPQPAPALQPEPPPQPAPAPAEPAKVPEPPPQPAPPPVAGPVDLDKALLAKTTRATAFIHVNVGKESATGSGFVVKSTGDTAYIITNYHVIDVEEKAAPKPGGPGMQWRFGRRIITGPPRMGPRGRRPAPTPKAERRVTVVFNSGTPEQQALPAEVVATDDESDLAALRVSGARNLPEALDVSQEAGVVEQQPVYIFGFPMNKARPAAGYPSITVGKGTVAGLRRDAGNNLIDVHINGDLNPGNSGGPIIDANGRLVGVSVAAVLGKQIGFAIPAGVLHQMFKGRLSSGVVLHLAQKGPQSNLSAEIWAYDHKGSVRGRKALSIPFNVPRGAPPSPADEYVLLARLADPMLKIKGAKAYLAVTEKVASPPNGQPWPKMATRFPPIALKIEDQFASGSFTLPKGVVPDRMFAFQFSYINADNKTIFTQPHLVRLTFPQNALSVTINISGIPDEPTRRYIEDMAVKSLPGKVRVVSWSKDKMVLEADPVPDPSVIAAKLTFGEVTSVQGRTFTVNAKKIDLPPPTDADVTSALAGLKSNNKQQRIAAAERLAKVYAILPERRAEVAKALEPLAGDKDIWIANPALRALYMWAGPENVAAVIPATGNNFTCGEAIKVLSRFKTAEVADALAKALPNGIARGPAAVALKKMGPIAEKAVIPFVNQGFWVGMEACNILKEIGTAECIPVLTQAVNDPKFPAKNAAQQALKSVQARTKRGAGG